jgi:predicted RNase H-like HicB family nuclease
VFDASLLGEFMLPTKYQIVIRYSESAQQYEARVLELPQCVGYGSSYATALAAAEHSLAKHHKESAESQLRELESGRKSVMRILRSKYGRLRHSEFHKQFGNGYTTTQFSQALSGCGTRELRAAIALAAGVPPSELWPHRSYLTRMRDNEMYLRMRLAQPAAKITLPLKETEKPPQEALA